MLFEPLPEEAQKGTVLAFHLLPETGLCVPYGDTPLAAVESEIGFVA